jgi:hypothetical protein
MEKINNDITKQVDNIHTSLIYHLDNLDEIIKILLKEQTANVGDIQSKLLPFIKNIKDVNKKILDNSIKLTNLVNYNKRPKLSIFNKFHNELLNSFGELSDNLVANKNIIILLLLCIFLYFSNIFGFVILVIILNIINLIN